MSQNKVIAAVEIGTNKVVVLVAEVIGDRSLNIIGRGECVSIGIVKGEVVNFKAATQATHDALSIAEKKAGRQIQSVYLACTGNHIDGMTTKGTAVVASSDHIVSKSDMEQAAAIAKGRNLHSGNVYISHIASGYRIQTGNEIKEVSNPLGLSAEQLEVDYWHVYGNEIKIKNLLDIITGFGPVVSDMIPSALATGRIVASERERREGVLVVDIGSGCTDYALYKNGAVQRVGVIPVGGDHLTNDLYLGLHVNFKNAESLKLRFGKAMVDAEDKDDSVLLFGDMTIGDQPICRHSIYRILQARVDELFMILKNRLGSLVSSQNVPCGIILSGGTSQLPNLSDTSLKVMGVKTRIGHNPDWITDDDLLGPEYSTVLGLLEYGLSTQRSHSHSKRSNRWGSKFKRIFSSN